MEIPRKERYVSQITAQFAGTAMSQVGRAAQVAIMCESLDIANGIRSLVPRSTVKSSNGTWWVVVIVPIYRDSDWKKHAKVCDAVAAVTHADAVKMQDHARLCKPFTTGLFDTVDTPAT